MPQRSRGIVALCVGMFALGGCGPKSAPQAVQPAGQPCALSPAPGAAVESLTVALTSSIDPAHAPIPRTAAERFVFALMYEPLVRIDCQGQRAAGLAASWTSSGRRTTFILRPDARFWGGDPVTARDVVASWRATGASRAGSLALRIADATSVIDDRTLSIALPDSETVPLADPELAISRPRSGGWAEGTGRYRPALAGPRTISLTPDAPPAARVIVRLIGERDARDALDSGADMLVTGDPDVVAYAAARPDLVAIPLPWVRTYVLLAPRRSTATVDSLGVVPPGATALRAALARDAVRAEARPAEPPYWWTHTGCESAGRPAPTSGGRNTPRIVYPRDDGVARGLAERLVALATVRDTSLAFLAPAPRLSAAGLPRDDLTTALRSGRDVAFVIPLPARSLAPCRDLQSLVTEAPWLAGNPFNAIVPLVDTRDRAIVKRDRVGLTVDWDGTLRLLEPRSP